VTRALPLLLTAPLLFSACKKSPPTANPTSTATAPSAAPPSARAKQADAERAAALAFLKSWLDAQNQGRFDAYAALYEPKHFRGVKRTRTGGVKPFDFAGWSADRRRLFQKGPAQVAAEHATVETWLDPKSKLKPGAMVLHFLQRWRNERYADHGEKVLHVWRSPEKKLLIVYEDLLNSEPGWGAVPPGATLDFAVPQADGEALALWRKLAPTGADWAAKLAQLPADPSVRRPMARALLAGGHFDCKETEEYGACGDEELAWRSLDPAAGFDDPCLRRELGLWALTDGGLTERDIKALLPAAQNLFTLAPPEKELPEALLALSEKFSEPLRLDLLRAGVTNYRELVEKSINGLSEEALVTLYRELQLDSAALALAPGRHPDVVADALRDGSLSVETRRKLLRWLKGLKREDARDAIIHVAEDESDCDLAMDAVLAMEERGELKYLPRWTKDASQPQLERALCMLARDPDPDRRLLRWREFLPPRGRVTVSIHVENEFAERDDDGNAEDQSPPDEFLSRSSTDADDVVTYFGQGGPHLASEGKWEAGFERGADGHLYLSTLHRDDYIGCSC
jgi:hypothetical protein